MVCNHYSNQQMEFFLISESSLKRLSSYLSPYPQGNKYSDFCHYKLVFTSSCTSCIYILWCMTSFIQHERCGFEIHPHCCMYLASLLETIHGVHWGFPRGSDGKESACNVGHPGSGRSPGEGNGNPLQYSCL